jgi:hypothetical protein
MDNVIIIDRRNKGGSLQIKAVLMRYMTFEIPDDSRCENGL